MSDQNEDYEVGYRKPPKSGQFKKGQSGNPKGRPKGAKGVKASLRRELESKITILEDGRSVKLSKAEVIAKSLTADALKGDSKSRFEILRLDDELFDTDKPGSGNAAPAQPEPIDYEILRHFFHEPDPVEDTEEDSDD